MMLGSEQLVITPLGAGSEVGRSCVLVKFKGKTIMLDCGVHSAHTGMAALPFFDEIDPDTVDLVLITHFHLDHAAGLPYFMEKTPFRGRVFMTHPTKAIYKWLLADYVRVSGASAGVESHHDDPQQLYSEADLARSFERITAIDYHQEMEVDGIRFVALNAGHVLGAAMFMIEIAGVRILYTGDYSREEDRHLMAAETPNERPDVLVTESTYGVHSHQPRLEREARFTSLVHEVVARGGRCLIPVFALGRAQELLLILDEYWQAHPELHSIPVYYASSLAKKCMAVYQTYVNMMNDRIRKQVAINNPFIFRHVSYLRSMAHFEDTGPCVMMASPAMLQSGLSRELLELWCPSAKNGLIIPGYVVEGTLAKHVLTEPKEIEAMSGATIPLRMTVEYISFSAHVDFGQNAEFIDILKPPHVVLVHGEANEMQRLKSALLHRYGLVDRGSASSAARSLLIGSANSSGVLNVHTPRNCEDVELSYRGERTIKIVGRLAASLTGSIDNSAAIRDSGAIADDGSVEKFNKVIESEDGKADVKIKDQSEATVIEGVLVGKDFEYQLMAPEDLSEFAQGIKAIDMRQRQAITCRAPFTLVEHLIRQLFGDGEVKRTASFDLTVKSNFLVQCDGTDSYLVEWTGNPMNDLIADSIVMLLLGAESSRLAVKATKSSHHHDHGKEEQLTGAAARKAAKEADKQADRETEAELTDSLQKIQMLPVSESVQLTLIKSYLENHYGHVTEVAASGRGKNRKEAALQFFVDGEQVAVSLQDYIVSCANASIQDQVTDVLQTIISMLDPHFII